MKKGQIREFARKESVINEGATVSQDPRIDSPEIKVTYAAQEVINTIPAEEPVIETKSIPRTVPIEQPKEVEVKEPHTCSITAQKAIEQNWIAFAIGTIFLIGIGMAIGKSMSKTVTP